MVAWFIAAFLLFLLARLPFIKAPLLYGYVEFQPGIVLVPLLGVFWGPAGALGIALASVVGDLLFGYGGSLVFYRMFGLFLYAMSAKKLWDYFSMRDAAHPGIRPTWKQISRFMMASLPGAFLAAGWFAFGNHMVRSYPFSYVLMLVLANNLLFLLVLGPAFFHALARELVPHFGCWREVMKNSGVLPPIGIRGATLSFVGSFGAVTAGFLVGTNVYGHWPLDNFLEGKWFLASSSGPLLTWAVWPFLLMQVLAILWPEGVSLRSLFVKKTGYALLVLCFMPVLLAEEDALSLTADDELNQVIYMNRPVKLPEADELLSEVRRALPTMPLAIEAVLQSRSRDGTLLQTYLASITIEWAPPNPRAEYIIQDAFGQELHKLVVERDASGQAHYDYATGSPLKKATLPDLHEGIENTDISWNDLMLSFLWWDQGETKGVEKIKGRLCYIIDLPVQGTSSEKYAGVRLWVDPKVHVMMRAATFDSQNEEIRRLDIKSLKKIEEIWVIKDVEVKNLIEKTKTRLRVREVRNLDSEEKS